MTQTETALFISAFELTDLTRDIWSTFVQVDLWPVADPGGPVADETVTGCIYISGGWEGTVFLELTREHAEHAAQVMFAAAPGTLSEDDVSDALGELTNMVAGNVKGALLAPTRLSLPWVARGASYAVRVPGTALLERVLFQSAAGPMRVSVWGVAP